MKETNKQDSPATAGIAAKIIGILVDLVRSKDDKNFRFHFPLASLPWDKDDFRMKLIQVACGGITWRSSNSLKVLPRAGGTVDAETFIKAVMALDFRGDEKPNKDDIANAKPILNSIECEMYTFEDVVKQIKSDPKYGWDIDPTPDGIAKHEMLKRLKLRSSKATTVALNTL